MGRNSGGGGGSVSSNSGGRGDSVKVFARAQRNANAAEKDLLRLKAANAPRSVITAAKNRHDRAGRKANNAFYRVEAEGRLREAVFVNR